MGEEGEGIGIQGMGDIPHAGIDPLFEGRQRQPEKAVRACFIEELGSFQQMLIPFFLLFEMVIGHQEQ